jgi:ADP-ribose pyrophosphatase YjhB (NUDIX family)
MKTSKERVRVLLPYGKRQYLMETLYQKRWPESIGHRRFPGGGIDEGETPQQALIRELKEELGYEADPNALEYLGRDYRPETANEHYFRLNEHTLEPGDFEDEANPGIPVKLRAGAPWGKNFIGANPKMIKQSIQLHPQLIERAAQAMRKVATDKTATTALRRLIKLVPQAPGTTSGYVRHNLTLGGKEIGRVSGVHQPTGFQVTYSEIDPKFQGMGLGKKMYGDLLKQLGGKPLLSDATVSPEAQRVWQSMANRPVSYTVKTNPAAQIRPGATAMADPTTIRMANSAASIKAKMSAPLWRRLLGMYKKPAAVPETQNNVFEAVLNRIGK